MTAAAALLVPMEDAPRFDRLWRLAMIRHDLPATEPEGWRKLAKARGPAAAAAVQEITGVASSMGGIGFVVAIGGKAWNDLPPATRRWFGSAAMLCFLRAMRIVIDKLEGSGDSSPIVLMLRRAPETLREGMDAAERLLAADTRARTRISTFSFVDGISDGHFAALDLLLFYGIERSALGRELASHPQREQVGQPPFPGNLALELWNQAFISRHLESVDWARPSQPAVRKRKEANRPID